MADALIKLAVAHHREVEILSITPKVHLIEDHAHKQYPTFTDGIALMIEDFVGINHQDRHKLKENFKRINSVKKRNVCCEQEAPSKQFKHKTQNHHRQDTGSQLK